MKMTLGSAVLVCSLLLPFAALADEEQVPTEKEVSQAESTPPLMPHALPEPGRDGFFPCLSCHGQAGGRAPQTPHPERLACTQCHVEGAVTAKSSGRKK